MSDFNLLTKPASRITGREKVTGAAMFGGDFIPQGTAYGHLVTSTIAKGRITGIDAAAAEAVPGVRLVLSHQNLADYPAIKSFYSGGLGQSSFWPLRGPEINYAGQIIAYVLADSLEAAREAAAKVTVTYEEDAAAAALETSDAEPTPIEPLFHNIGDADQALGEAEFTVEAEYTTPVHHHNPIEMFATSAHWQGDNLTVYLPTQAVTTTKQALSQQLDMAPARIKVISPFVGGAFGSKATVTPYITLTALAAKKLGRPVKLYVTRAQMYTVASYRPASVQKIALGATADGTLTAYTHEQIGQTSRIDNVVNPGTEITTRMYACPNIKTREYVKATDTNSPGFMRAPLEVPTFFAFESAIDELAHKVGMDPVDFRLKNDTMNDPITGVPFSSRSLKECYQAVAKSFGWYERDPGIGAMRDNDELVGYGCATACYPTQISASSARVRLAASGHADVELAAHDVGTGAYTVMGMVAAERLGLPLGQIKVAMGHSDYPVAPIAGGSVTTASAGSAVWAACEKIRAQLAEAVTQSQDSPLSGEDPASLTFVDGQIRGSGNNSLAVQDAVAMLPTLSAEAVADWAHPDMPQSKIKAPYQGSFAIIGPVNDQHAMFAFGAEFVEVRINPRTKSIRVPRIAGAFAAGNILNQKAGHSQLLGGMVWGIGSALHEHTEIDTTRARYVNANIAEYLIPVNADIREVAVEIIPEEDRYVNPLGAKGIGEMGVVGTAAAIANAVYHATGVRVRKLPIRMEDVLTAASA